MATSVQQIEAARAHGILQPQVAADAADRARVPFHVACAFLMQETGGGRNVFGHDPSGNFVGAGEVTHEKYIEYRRRRRAGEGMQGVGPMQLTWWEFQDRADDAGGCWRPEINMLVGFQIVREHYDRLGSWREAARVYNGSGPAAEAYADRMADRFIEWKDIVGMADVGEGRPYERVIYHGRTFDNFTVAALQEMERRLGYPLTITQGSYNSSVGASAGTHAGGGAVDLAEYDHARKVRIGREVGFAMWHRPAIPGLWGGHCHGILYGHQHLSDDAQDQIADYKAGRNGLANNGPDTGPRIPLQPFRYDQVVERVYETGDVYVSKLRLGVSNSDSVKRMQYRLANAANGASPHLPVDGDFGDRTRWALRKWQWEVALAEPNDGRWMSNAQAHRIFGDRYTVVEDDGPPPPDETSRRKHGKR